MAKFILFDQDHLIYGARVLVSGIDISEFQLNPIMLFNHHRTWRGSKDEMLPIGKWENTQKEGTKLTANDYYDNKDDFAQAIASKVEQGILNMASVTLMVVSTSEDPNVLVLGQTRPTIIESKLIEASIVDIGRNKGAYKMRMKKVDEAGNEVEMPAYIHLIDQDGKDIDIDKENHLLPLLKARKPESGILNLELDMDKKQLAISLGLKEDASDAEILQAQQNQTDELIQLRQLKQQKEQEAAELKQFRDAAAATAKTEREKVVDDAIKARQIVAADREKYLELMEKAPESAKAIIAKLPAVAELKPGAEGEKTDVWSARFDEIRNGIK